MMFLQQFHQIGRSTRLEPITAEFLIFERIEQTKRIVHADRMMCKVIAVIICFQIVTKLVVWHSSRFSKLMQFGIQIIMQNLIQTLRSIILLDVQIQMQNRISVRNVAGGSGSSNFRSLPSGTPRPFYQYRNNRPDGFSRNSRFRWDIFYCSYIFQCFIMILISLHHSLSFFAVAFWKKSFSRMSTAL